MPLSWGLIYTCEVKTKGRCPKNSALGWVLFGCQFAGPRDFLTEENPTLQSEADASVFLHQSHPSEEGIFHVFVWTGSLLKMAVQVELVEHAGRAASWRLREGGLSSEAILGYTETLS